LAQHPPHPKIWEYNPLFPIPHEINGLEVTESNSRTLVIVDSVCLFSLQLVFAHIK